MLEIILLIQLTKSIGRIADQKGLKIGTWKLYVILAWFGGEVLGAVVGALIFNGDLLSTALVAYPCAIGSYFIVKGVLKKKPDAFKGEWIEQIGQEEGTAELPAQ